MLEADNGAVGIALVVTAAAPLDEVDELDRLEIVRDRGIRTSCEVRAMIEEVDRILAVEGMRRGSAGRALST